MRRLILSLLLISIVGCPREKKKEPEKISAYGLTLTKNSPPKEVAGLLIKGLDNEDESLLVRLVAIKYEMREVEEILKSFSKRLTPERVASLTASGWLLTYSFFLPGKTRIEEERIEGDSAYVYARGEKRDGRMKTLEVKMVREDGWWKVTAGLKEED
jgi:hypothetical protein|uniref:DUF4878 domain-containing protein n=1 Tax=candidate division WOR-3 bacterium TaxID=2052148 RepID=A0A7C3UW02_UNCW3